MSEHVKWTEENPVSDESMLSHWERLIIHIAGTVARTYRLSNEDKEDIVADLQVRLLRLSQEKRPFEAYVRMVLNNAARDSIVKLVGAGGGRNWKPFTTVGFESVAPRSKFDDEVAEGTSLMDMVIPAEDSPEDALVHRTMLLNAISTLQRRQGRCIIAYYLEDRTIQQIADDLGMSTSGVSASIKNGLKKLKRKLRSG